MKRKILFVCGAKNSKLLIWKSYCLLTRIERILFIKSKRSKLSLSHSMKKKHFFKLTARIATYEFNWIRAFFCSENEGQFGIECGTASASKFMLIFEETNPANLVIANVNSANHWKPSNISIKTLWSEPTGCRPKYAVELHSETEFPPCGTIRTNIFKYVPINKN